MNPQPKFAAVCFDCDSTLSRIEGIDELASRRGLKREISRLTEAAMNGSLALDAVYAERLSMVSPDEAAMAWLGSPEGHTFVATSSNDWARAAVASGTDAAEARAAAERTIAAYTGQTAIKK